MAFYSKTIKLNELHKEVINNLKLNGWTEKLLPANCLPNLSANTEGQYSVVASQTYSNRDAFRAFSGDMTNYWSSSTTSNVYLRFNFGAGNAKIITGYSLLCSHNASYTPMNFRFEGSNDNSIWTTLDTRANETGWSTEYRRYYTFTNTTPYRYYRIFIESSNSTSYVSISDFAMYEDLAVAISNNQTESLMTSKGTSGVDNIFMLVSPGSTKQVQGNALKITVGESYDLNETTRYKISREISYYTASTSTSTANSTNVMLNYYMEVDADRLLIATVLDPSALYSANNVMYLGLLKRYMDEGNNHALTIATGMGEYSSARLLRNKSLGAWASYNSRVIGNDYSPSVWGDVVFVTPVFMEGVYEGMRGELKGVYTCRAESIVNEDEITVGTTKYKAIVVTAWSSNSFPYAPVLFKLPTVTP